MTVKVKGHYGTYDVEVDGVVIGVVDRIPKTDLWNAVPDPKWRPSQSWGMNATFPEGTTVHRRRRDAVAALVNGTGDTI